MRYKILVFGIVFFVAIIVIMEYDKSAQSKILGFSDNIKAFFLDEVSDLQSTYDRHFNQAKTLERLNAEVAEKDKLSLEVIALNNEIRRLNDLLGSQLKANAQIHLARILSFASLAERSKVWLDTKLELYHKDLPLDSRIFGMVKDNAVIGTAVVQNGRLEGFLNGSKFCHYDVYIGESRVVGIISGNNEGKLVVDYIPPFATINKGDRVFTSGLDGIFFENIPVGVVENIVQNYGYLSAEVKPYTSVDSLAYVWIIDRESAKLESSQDAQ